MAPYARFEVTLIAVLGALLALAATFVHPFAAIVPLALAAALLSFYRDPLRRSPLRDDVLVAPADGRITAIEGAESGGTAPIRIVIFLSVLDVHVNRSPCAGRVQRVEYRAGAFLNALRADSTERNERNDIVLDPDPPLAGPIVVRQIAGVLARRIVCAVRSGEKLACGQRVGMIKLGSRTTLTLPASPRARVAVRVGEHVKGGSTILAEFAPAKAAS